MKQIQSLAQKSVYWMKVISLGLILGIGIQFAQAWTNPGSAPPGGNISGPLTNGIIAQYKTGMLGVNSTTTPINALEVGGGGNAYIGGSLFTGGSINAVSGTVTGVLTAGKVQIVDVVIANSACAPNGLVARDSTGLLLSCQSGTWKKASGGGSPAGTWCGMMRVDHGGPWLFPCQGMQGCPVGYTLQSFSSGSDWYTCINN